jgi:hypothetical protein
VEFSYAEQCKAGEDTCQQDGQKGTNGFFPASWDRDSPCEMELQFNGVEQKQLSSRQYTSS